MDIHLLMTVEGISVVGGLDQSTWATLCHGAQIFENLSALNRKT